MQSNQQQQFINPQQSKQNNPQNHSIKSNQQQLISNLIPVNHKQLFSYHHHNLSNNQNSLFKYFYPSVNQSSINHIHHIKQSQQNNNKIQNNQQHPTNLHKSYATQNHISNPNQQNLQNFQSALQIDQNHLLKKIKKIPSINPLPSPQPSLPINYNNHQQPPKANPHKLPFSQHHNQPQNQNLCTSLPNIQNKNISIQISNVSIVSVNNLKKKLKYNHSPKPIKKQQDQIIGNNRSIGVGHHQITQQDLEKQNSSNSDFQSNNLEICHQQIQNNQPLIQSKQLQQHENKQSLQIKQQLEKSIPQQNDKLKQQIINNEQQIPLNTQLPQQRQPINKQQKSSIIKELSNQKLLTHSQQYRNDLEDDFSPITNQPNQSLKKKNHNTQSLYQIKKLKNNHHLHRNINHFKQKNSKKLKQLNQQHPPPNPSKNLDQVSTINLPTNEPPIQTLNYSSLKYFNIKLYTQIYNILKSIQTILKAPTINIKQIIHLIKKYLQIIALAQLDSIDGIDLILHKKKIIKNSLFIQRLSIIILVFSYTVHSLKQSLNYLINLIGFSITNCLILIKIMSQTQITPPNTTNNQHPPQKILDQVFLKSNRFALNRNLQFLKNNNNISIDFIHKLTKTDINFHYNIMEIIKQINKYSIDQVFYSLLEYFAYYLCSIQRDHMVPFLAISPNPYLHLSSKPARYSLIIDCIYLFCQNKKSPKIPSFRPHTQHFLTEMTRYYQIISYCPYLPHQIDQIIDILDPKSIIEHRLYKYHTINNNGQYIKCLDRLGRNDDEIILIDNENGGGSGSLQNCIHVPIWRGTKTDTILAELCPFLAMITLRKLPARQAIKRYRDQLQKNSHTHLNYINFQVLFQ